MKVTLKVTFWIVAGLLLVSAFGSVFGALGVGLDGVPFYVGFFGSLIFIAIFVAVFGVVATVIWLGMKLYEWIDNL